MVPAAAPAAVGRVKPPPLVMMTLIMATQMFRPQRFPDHDPPAITAADVTL